MRSGLVLAICGLLGACAGPGGLVSAGQSEGTLLVGRPCGAVYTAALMAVPDAGYEVTSMDRASGTIAGIQQTALGGGGAIGLTVRTVPQGTGCLLTATIVAPPMALTPSSGRVDVYLEAVMSQAGPDSRMAYGKGV